jgi:sulfur-carrier protein
MKIKVKYFAQVAEAVGRSQEELDCAEGDGADLPAFFIRHYPKLAALTWKVAVDQEIVDGPVVLHEFAEVVLLPPFAGG